MCKSRGDQRTPAARIIAAAFILVAGTRASAQAPVQIDFNRPEAWALKYYTAVSMFTGLEPPSTRQPGSVGFGLELGWIPYLSESERRVGFEGTKVEDLNKVPILVRPRVAVGLPGGITAELGWVPPVEVNGATPNLLAAALERPFLEDGRWTLGLRLYGQIGHAKGDFTCSKDAIQEPPGSDANPLGCAVPSEDTSTLNYAGAAITGGVKLGGGARLHFAAGGTYNDLEFQVGAYTSDGPDNTHLAAHGWTGWTAAGATFSLGKRASFAIEAFYSPLLVRRPPREDTQNDGLFNVRALLRYQIF